MFCRFPVLFIVAGTLISPKLLRVGTWVSVFFFFSLLLRIRDDLSFLRFH